MTDKNGLRVEARTIDGVPQFVVTRHGYLVHGERANGTADPRTVEDLVALGVDIASLA